MSIYHRDVWSDQLYLHSHKSLKADLGVYTKVYYYKEFEKLMFDTVQ